MRSIQVFLLGILILMMASPSLAQDSIIVKDLPEPTEARRYIVDCDRVGLIGLQRTLDQRTEGVTLIVEFTGTCEGSLKIRRDDVILRGGDETAILRGQLATLGVSRVKLEGFTVRDTPAESPIFDRDGDGILVESSQLVELFNMQVINTGARGINIQNNSSAFVRDTHVTGARGIGLVGVASSITLQGHVTANDGLGNGICVFNAGTIFTRPGALVEADRNQIGVLIESQGAITLADNSTISAKENSIHGYYNAAQGAFTLANAKAEAIDNAFWGIITQGVSHIEPLLGSNPVLEITGNGAGGIAILRDSNVMLTPGSTISDNGGFGVVVDEGTLWVNGGVEMTGNAGFDLAMIFGARVTLNGSNEIGSPPVCDGSQMLRGAECVIPSGAVVEQVDPTKGMPQK